MKMKLDGVYQLEYSDRDLSHFNELEIQRYDENRSSNFHRTYAVNFRHHVKNSVYEVRVKF